MKKLLTVVALAILLAPGYASAQSAADSAAIRATALDYIEGWYNGDGARMQRALHPDLAKRIVRDADGRYSLSHMTAAQLSGAAASGGGKETPAAERRKGVRILDIFGNTASVRADMSGWIDYMHMAKWEGRWVIVNVLWETRPRS